MRVIVAVIAYNEEQNIRETIQDLKAHDFGYDILVVDNGSYDGTVRICKELGIDVVSHCVNSGCSFGTVMTYFLYASRHDYDVLCQFDGDGQHMAQELPKIIQPIRDDQADYVIGSRFLEKEGFQSSFLRRIGINLFSLMTSRIIRQTITDVTSGFRAYNRNVINFFAKYYRHEVYDTSQLLLLSYFSGARIKEVSTPMKMRQYGKSEYNFFRAITFPVKGIINIIGCLLQRNQIEQIVGNQDGNSN